MEGLEKRELLLERLRDLSFAVLSKEDQATELNVSRQHLWRLLKSISREEWAEVVKDARKAQSADTPAVLAAIAREAKKGKVPAAELYLMYVEGWTPKTAMSLEAEKSPLEGMTAQQEGAFLINHLAWNPVYNSPRPEHIAWILELVPDIEFKALEDGIAEFKRRQAEKAAIPAQVVDVQALPEPGTNGAAQS